MYSLSWLRHKATRLMLLSATILNATDLPVYGVTNLVHSQGISIISVWLYFLHALGYR